MRNLFFLSVFALVLFSGSVFAQTKIAVVDLEKVIMETKAGKKFSEEFQGEYNKAMARGQKMVAEVESAQKDFETQQNILSNEAKQKKATDIQKKRVEIERFQKDTQEDLQRKQLQFLDSIVKEIKPILSEYAKEKKIDLILDGKEGMAWYVNPAIDISEDIVKRFDAQWKNK